MGIRLRPESTGSSSQLGDFQARSDLNKTTLHNGISASPIVTEDHAATLTNKTVDFNNNTILNIPSTSLLLADGLIIIGNSSGTSSPVLMSGDVTITDAGVTTVSSVGGSSASSLHSSDLDIIASTSNSTPSTIVKRDSSGNFSAGIISADLNGNALTATSATDFTGSLSGDVTGTQLATSVSKVNGASIPASATIVGTNISNQLIDASLTTLSNNTTGTASNITGTVVVGNGGTGVSSFTPYAVITGGTTSSGALQSISGLGNASYVLTSNGPGSLPTFQINPSAAKAVWSGYHTVSSGWSTSSSTFADPSAGNTVVLTEQINSGMGTVSTASGDLPGITLTFPDIGQYKIEASVTSEAGGGGTVTLRLTDGTTAFVPSASKPGIAGGGQRGSTFLSGIYTAGAGSTTIKVQIADATGTSASIENGSAAGSAAITWTIVQL